MRPPHSLARRLALATLLAGCIPAIAAALALLLSLGKLHSLSLSHPLALPTFAGVLCVTAVVGGLWCARLGRKIVRTLHLLSEQAEAMARGDLMGRVEIPGRRSGAGCRDELDQVAHALNLLSAQLTQQITERDRFEGEQRLLRAQLERRIQERTAALEEAQRQILRVEKRSALGQLVAGIAHEINNHVNFITSAAKPVEMGVADLLSVLETWRALSRVPAEQIAERIQAAQAAEEDLEIELASDEMGEALQHMREGAQRIRAIVTNLRTFSHRGDDTAVPTDLEDLVERTITLVRPRLGEHVDLRVRAENVGKVACLPVQMSQVLINLLVNATDAVGDTGTITVRIWRERDEVNLSVQDTGSGIPATHLPRIFDPFFTTKDVGEGTGLGLYVCQQILEELGGGIHVESILGEGTEVTLHWPREIVTEAKDSAVITPVTQAMM